jgi:putative flippase GtrA
MKFTKTDFWQFIKFMLCNQAAWLADLLVFTLLYQVNAINYIASKAASYTAGAAVSYFLNRRFTFAIKSGKHIELPKFVVVNSFAVALSLVSMYFFKNYLRLAVWEAYFLSILFSFTTNYFGNKLWVFRKTYKS